MYPTTTAGDVDLRDAVADERKEREAALAVYADAIDAYAAARFTPPASRPPRPNGRRCKRRPPRT